MIRLLTLLVCLAAALPAAAPEPVPTMRIPKVRRPPKLEDFLTGRPREAELVITDFRQLDPVDGAPITQATTAFLSYDDENLYAGFIARDSDPKSMRIRKAKRENILWDDRVTINIDTFHDHRRGFFFDANAYGIQMDGVTTEGQGDDFSWDALWYSEGKITDFGYVVLETIPFRSLRFPDTPKQTWGFVVARFIHRNNEWGICPPITRRKFPQWVAQFGHLEGLEGISPGRNLQFIPYGLFSGGRFLDLPGGYRTEKEGRVGLDAKAVIKDSFTLDMAANPDFSQVESDEPQVLVNQRYEVYFPEKRPLFIENASMFSTPEKLFFSRRIVDPQFGVRLTGKAGPWAIGALAADDRAPEDGRAGIGVLRIARELDADSQIGVLATSRDFGSSHNRVIALDTRLKLKPGWFLDAQAMSSDTRDLKGNRYSGPAYLAKLVNAGKHFGYSSQFTDRSPSFRSDLGYIPRVDIREMKHHVEYLWRPEGGAILSFGPALTGLVNWNRAGQVQDWLIAPEFKVEMPHLSQFTISHSKIFELYDRIGFRKQTTDVVGKTEWLKWLIFQSTLSVGSGVNYYPASGRAPFLANSQSNQLQVSLLPNPQLRVDQTYIYSRLGTRDAGEPGAIFNNHILRTKLNYQFTRELALRTIMDYNAVLPNAGLVSLERSKRIGADVLLSYLLNPGTALYVGYTDIHENLLLDPTVSPQLRRGAFPDTLTGRQFFVKLSYLLRY